MVSRKAPAWPCRQAKNINDKSTVNLCDYNGVRTTLDVVENKLFKQDGTVELLVCRWNEKEKLTPTPIFSYDELDTYLEKHIKPEAILTNQPPSSSVASCQTVPTHVPLTALPPIQKPLIPLQPPQEPPSPSTYLFLIDQEHTKSSLDITRDSLNRLLSAIDAFPQLGSALPAFAALDIPVHEGRTAFNGSRSIASSGTRSLEMCMLLKYVELNGNKSDPIPYSVRQQLLYQKYGGANDLEAVVLIRGSAALKRRITEEYHVQGGWARHWANVPVLVVSTLACNWAEYCRFLDEGVWKIDKSSTHTNPFLPSLGEANFKTLQSTQKWHDLLTRASHVLKNNIRVLSSLLRESQKRRSVDSVHSECYDDLDSAIEEAKEDLEGFSKHLELIQARLTRITEGIRDSIALRSSHHAATETENMRSLTAQSIREARTVKAIALVTLIYLPATFVATFLGMNTLEVSNQGRGRLAVSIDPEMWIYLALTIPLTLCTLAAWWGWEWWSRRNAPETKSVSWKEDDEGV